MQFCNFDCIKIINSTHKTTHSNCKMPHISFKMKRCNQNYIIKIKLLHQMAHSSFILPEHCCAWVLTCGVSAYCLSELITTHHWAVWPGSSYIIQLANVAHFKCQRLDGETCNFWSDCSVLCREAVIRSVHLKMWVFKLHNVCKA